MVSPGSSGCGGCTRERPPGWTRTITARVDISISNQSGACIDQAGHGCHVKRGGGGRLAAAAVGASVGVGGRRLRGV